MTDVRMSSVRVVMVYRINYHYVQGARCMESLSEGNIRCFLKLSGTAYMPDLNGKILLLESRYKTRSTKSKPISASNKS